jgi:hypothetical protein
VARRAPRSGPVARSGRAAAEPPRPVAARSAPELRFPIAHPREISSSSDLPSTAGRRRWRPRPRCSPTDDPGLPSLSTRLVTQPTTPPRHTVVRTGTSKDLPPDGRESGTLGTNRNDVIMVEAGSRGRWRGRAQDVALAAGGCGLDLVGFSRDPLRPRGVPAMGRPLRRRRVVLLLWRRRAPRTVFGLVCAG